MNIRHLAFLARQPSAVFKKRDHFWGMPKRGLAFLLANVMFWQPVWAQADGIVVSAPGTTLDRAGNGVPIINIATPNGAGLSHNQFHDYNVDAPMTLTTDEALSAGQKYLGPDYREIGKPGSGVFHSADGTKEFRIDSGSISGVHAPGVPHVHFGVKDPATGKYISNNHVPYAD